jgi:hypothetical protein
MKMTDNLIIQFEYITHNDARAAFTLSAQEYLDPEFMDDESDIESVRRFTLAIEYLDVPRDTVRSIRLSVRNPLTERERRFTEAYWNHGDNWVVLRRDLAGGTVIDEELIVHTEQSDLVSMVMRFRPVDGVFFPIYHGIFTKNPDGSVDELRFA